MGFLFKAYDPRPHHYHHGYIQAGGTPNHSQLHYLHKPQYPHGQHHGYDYLTQSDYPAQYPYPNPYPYDHINFAHQQPYSRSQQYQQYSHYQQIPIPYQSFYYDTRSESPTYSTDIQQSK